MNNKLSTNKFAFASALCFFVLAVKNAIYIKEAFQYEDDLIYCIEYIVRLCSSVSIALLMIKKKRNSNLMIAAGAYFLFDVLFILKSVIHMYISFWTVFRLLYLAAALAFVALNCISSIQHNAKKINMFWFIPGALFGLDDCLKLCMNLQEYFNNTYYLIRILTELIEDAGILLLCLWLYKTYEYTPAPAKKRSLVSPRQINPNVSNYSFVDGAEQLMKYKQLLDDGVITQEEFDAKKKQILEL